MKNFLKNDIVLIFTLFFLFLFFKENEAIKNCILNGCTLFFKNVFPSLFPMFIIQDILLNYNFFDFINKIFGPFFSKVFHMSPISLYVFILSLFSGTPINAYLATHFVQEQKCSKKEASLLLTYSCFFNPLFLYNMLMTIFQDQNIVIKLILINYGINFIWAFFLRNIKIPKQINLKMEQEKLSFSKVLSKSIERSSKILITILGTIIFYLVICEGVHFFIKSPILNCFINGLLEATGGLSKLATLNINIQAKKIMASIFISFMGLSIHTQIKNIIADASISSKPFLLARFFHTFILILLTIC